MTETNIHENTKQTNLFNFIKDDDNINIESSLWCKNKTPEQCCINKLCFCDKLDYYNENIESIIKMQSICKQFIIKKSNISYYISSLVYCEYQINTIKNKALKDIVGHFYEEHIKRCYVYYTNLKVTTKNEDFGFTPDCCMIDDKMNNVLVTEIKGHYLDSCFLERALVGIVKSINILTKKNKKIPIFEIHSFTTYKLFYEKLNDFREIINNNLVSILYDKLIYTTICSRVRLKKEMWFNKDSYKKCYTTNLNLVNIRNHIDVIRQVI